MSLKCIVGLQCTSLCLPLNHWLMPIKDIMTAYKKKMLEKLVKDANIPGHIIMVNSESYFRFENQQLYYKNSLITEINHKKKKICWLNYSM